MPPVHTHLPKYNLGAHFLTASTFRRKPYFGDPHCARIFCEELEAARARYGFFVLAFVVMPDHVHLLLWWDVEPHPHLTISKIAWAVKGKSARRIVDYLKGMDKGGQEGWTGAMPSAIPGSAPRQEAGEGREGVGGGNEGVGEGNALACPNPKHDALAYPNYPEPGIPQRQRADEGNALAYPGHDRPEHDPLAHPGAPLEPSREPENRPHRRKWRYQIWQPGAGYDFNVYTERKLRQKIAYIHANPVRAGLVFKPEDYPWSSAAFYQGLPNIHGVTITSFAEVLTG